MGRTIKLGFVLLSCTVSLFILHNFGSVPVQLKFRQPTSNMYSTINTATIGEKEMENGYFNIFPTRNNTLESLVKEINTILIKDRDMLSLTKLRVSPCYAILNPRLIRGFQPKQTKTKHSIDQTSCPTLYNYEKSGGLGVRTWIIHWAPAENNLDPRLPGNLSPYSNTNKTISHSDISSQLYALQLPVKRYYNCYMAPGLLKAGGLRNRAGSMSPMSCSLEQCSGDLKATTTDLPRPPVLYLLTDYHKYDYGTRCSEYGNTTQASAMDYQSLVEQGCVLDVVIAIDKIVIGGTVLPGGQVVTNKKEFLYGNSVSTAPNVLIRKFCKKESTNKIKSADAVFISTQDPGPNFYHFFCENIPRIAPFVLFLKTNPDIKIHVQEKYAKQMEFWVSVYGLKNQLVFGLINAAEIYLPHGGGTHNQHTSNIQLAHKYYEEFIERTLVPKYVDTSYHEHYGSTTATNKSVIAGVNNIKNYDASHTTKTLNLFRQLPKLVILIKRKERPLNELDAIQSLVQHLAQGYLIETVVFDDLALPDIEHTMLMFNRAALVIGPHGAHMSNLLFAPSTCQMVEIHCQRDMRMSFRQLTLKLGMRSYHFLSTNPPKSSRCNKEGVYVDLDELRCVLEHAFGLILPNYIPPQPLRGRN